MQYYLKASPQISNSAEKIEGAVPHGYEGVLAEEDGLRSVGWLGELGKYYSSHTSLRNKARYCVG